MVRWIDFYEVLQVSPHADPEVIEGAYKRLAKKHHPDLSGDSEKMKLINEAYAILRDPGKRAAYDKKYFAQAEVGASAYTEAEMHAAIFNEMIRPRPWSRLLARFVDLTVWMLVFWSAAELFIPYSFWLWLGIESSLAFGLIILALWIPIEAALLSAFGTTPGKQLWRIRVVNTDGGTLSYLKALKRSVGVFGWGLGLGIPLISLICVYLSYNSLKTWGVTKWDASAGSILLHGYLGLLRTIVALVVVVGLFMLAYWPEVVN